MMRMKISAKARYGLRILLDIALNETPDRPRLMKDICEAQGLSEKFTSRLVIPLRENGMIHSQRGKLGGFRLAKAPGDITLLDIIEALQGPIAVIDCLGDGTACARTRKCAARQIWSDVNAAIKNALQGITLESVIAKIATSKAIPSALAEYVI